MKAVEVTNVTKTFRQYDEEQMFLKRLVPSRRRRPTDIVALQDISFDVEAGTNVGIIGRNGSGKTTMLRLLSGVSSPTTGSLTVRGRLAPLIGIGAGFNNELSGRENILVNGRLLGLSAEELEERFDEIVDFSEIPNYIDTPVKYYSSGMFLRLAASVALHVDPDVFLLDEILAVGDLSFRMKCIERMREITDSGATVIVVTHNIETLGRISDRVIVLDRGEKKFDGPTDEGIDLYQNLLQSDPRGAGARIRADGVEVDVEEELPAAAATLELASRRVDGGEPIRGTFRIDFPEDVEEDFTFGLWVGSQGVGGIYWINTAPGQYVRSHGPNRPMTGTVEFQNPLATGTYLVRLIVRDRNGSEVAISPREHVVVAPGRSSGRGVVDLHPRMFIDEEEMSMNGLAEAMNLRNAED